MQLLLHTTGGDSDMWNASSPSGGGGGAGGSDNAAAPVAFDLTADDDVDDMDISRASSRAGNSNNGNSSGGGGGGGGAPRGKFGARWIVWQTSDSKAVNLLLLTNVCSSTSSFLFCTRSFIFQSLFPHTRLAHFHSFIHIMIYFPSHAQHTLIHSFFDLFIPSHAQLNSSSAATASSRAVASWPGWRTWRRAVLQTSAMSQCRRSIMIGLIDIGR
jgi:hypothetical protein